MCLDEAGAGAGLRRWGQARFDWVDRKGLPASGGIGLAQSLLDVFCNGRGGIYLRDSVLVLMSHNTYFMPLGYLAKDC